MFSHFKHKITFNYNNINLYQQLQRAQYRIKYLFHIRVLTKVISIIGLLASEIIIHHYLCSISTGKL